MSTRPRILSLASKHHAAEIARLVGVSEQWVSQVLQTDGAKAARHHLRRCCAGRHAATADEYAADPLGHADDFCALARFEPHKAAAQLGKMIRTTRARENRNRHYFDPLRGDSPELYIQLLRPWMREANDRGAAEWTASQRRGINDWRYQFSRFTTHRPIVRTVPMGTIAFV